MSSKSKNVSYTITLKEEYPLGVDVRFVVNGERGAGIVVGHTVSRRLWRSGVTIKNRTYPKGYIQEEITHYTIEFEYTDLLGDSQLGTVTVPAKNVEEY